jgi:DNA-binding IclR family transcriptional regulator
VEQLAHDTGEYVHLMGEESGRGVYLYQESGENGIADEYMTKKYSKGEYLHFTSLGKAIMAFLSPEQVNKIVAKHGLPKETPNTITDIDELHEELADIREQGYALNDEEQIRGARAVGAPIMNPADEVLGAISVSATSTRLNEAVFREEMPERVMQSANIIEVHLDTSTDNMERMES